MPSSLAFEEKKAVDVSLTAAIDKVFIQATFVNLS